MNSYYNLTSKYQITIPKEIRDTLGITSDDRISFGVVDGKAYIQKVPTLEEVRANLQADLKRRNFKQKVSQEDMNNARDSFYKKGLRWE